MTRDHNFLSSEDGAVTVDWVVLTAAVVGLAIVSVFQIANGSQNMGDSVRDYLTDVELEDLQPDGTDES